MAKTLIGNVKGPPGVTPHIGENGNWWIGETDTGVAATAGAVLYTTQNLTEAQKAQARANINAVGKNSLTLGVHTDGLIYLFVDGAPVGNGIEQSTGVNGDVVGYVDENNNIVLTGGLADGTYNVKYEMEDGTTIDIGELALTEDGPAYTNLADPTSAEWKEGYRISSGGVEEPTAGMTLVNTIAVGDGDIVRIKGMTGVVCGLYKDGAWYARKTVNATNFAVGATEVVIDGDYTQFKPGVACTNLTAIRLYGKLSGTAEDVIITVNEEITD